MGSDEDRSIHDWLLSDIISGVGPKVAGDELCDRLMDKGVPIDRAHFLALLVHPLYHGRSFLWTRATSIVVEDHRHGLQTERGWRDSLFKKMVDGELPDVLELDLRQDDLPYTPLPALRAEGFTGYLAMVVRYSDGRRQIISFSTRAPEGFSEENLALLKSLNRVIAVRVEVAMRRDIGLQVLSTYLGAEPARKVLNGSIRRGDIEEIDAAIWFSDLRGFTRLSTELAPKELGAFLGDYFQVVVDAVRASGGEVLKFIGDAVLAIFHGADGDPGSACRAAADAARELMEALPAVDAAWRARGVRCRAGVALHIGTVLYGNVGAADRLDFTVIGPAVNLASRLEGCAKDRGISIVTSHDFAEQVGVPMRLLGTYALDGIAEPQRAYTFASLDGPGE